MKLKLFSIHTFISLLLIGCTVGTGNKKVEKNLNSDAITNGIPQIYFENTEHDFGKIFQGEKVSYTFKFKNIGSADLIVKNATASCGCTVPKYPRKPILVGDTGEIEVIFDSSNRNGKQVKTVTVWTNCETEQIKLQITSEIVELN